jgi:hypothetical protein
MTSQDRLIEAGFRPQDAQQVAHLLYELAQARQVPEAVVTETYIRCLKEAERELLQGTSTNPLPPKGLLAL